MLIKNRFGIFAFLSVFSAVYGSPRISEGSTSDEGQFLFQVVIYRGETN